MTGRVSRRDHTGPRAGAVAMEVMARLADPAALVWDASEEAAEEVPVDPCSLGTGPAGVSLLFSTTGRDSDARRAHGHLAAAVEAVRRAGRVGGGLYAGLGALAFAAHMGAVTGGGHRYDAALTSLDEGVTTVTRAVMAASPEEGPARVMSEFDVVSGLSGLGRLLLCRGPRFEPLLRDVLRHLVAGTGTADHPRGDAVPRWWVRDGGPTADPDEAHLYTDGHLNLGLAHGVCGPLLLLTRCWDAGIRIDGHEAAVENLVELLLARTVRDRRGPFWPQVLTLNRWRGTEVAPPGRPVSAWCYGVPGQALALHAAGTVLDRPDWCSTAAEAVHGLVAAPLEDWHVQDAGLCHGWAGLLVLFADLARTTRDPTLDAVADDIAERVVASFDPSSRFGYRAVVRIRDEDGAVTSDLADHAGFLTGAAGVAIALNTYAGAADARWLAALML